MSDSWSNLDREMPLTVGGFCDIADSSESLRRCRFKKACQTRTRVDRLAKEVASAREEANDIVRHLKPLRPHILRIVDGSDFSALPEAFGALMQTMLLVWTHSRHFNTPAKLLALLRRLCNAIISQSRAYLPGTSTMYRDDLVAV